MTVSEHCQLYAVYMMFMALCGFIVFGPYMLQNPVGKSNKITEVQFYDFIFPPQKANTGEIHYHKENKTNGGKQIEFSAESNQLEKKSKWE